MREAEVKRSGEERKSRVGKKSYGSAAFPLIFFWGLSGYDEFLSSM